MVKSWYLYVVVFLVYGVNGIAQSPTPKNKAVFIIVDGIAEDMLESVHTPHLDQVAKEGSFLKAYVGGVKGSYNETPTISAVGYNSLLTGTWFNKHQVFDNYNQNPNYHYPTIFKLFSDQYPDRKTAIFSTWEDNRTVLLGEGKAETNKLKMDCVFDGYEKDTLRFPHDSDSEYIRNIDSLVVQKAVQTLQDEAPDLSWVYLQYTDDIAHRNGDGEALNRAISFEDHLIGLLYTAIREREEKEGENWLFLVTTDHGRQEDGHGHGGQSDRERNIWMILNKSEVNTYATHNRVGIVDVFPTLASHLNIELPMEIKREIDGVNLRRKASVFDLAGEWDENELILEWETTSDVRGRGEILYSTTNRYQEGGEDEYKRLGEVSLKDGIFHAPLEETPKFLKVVLKAGDEVLNTWLMDGNE